MRIQNDAIIASGDMSGNINSDTVWLGHIYGYSIQAVWTGTSPVGTLKLQGSNDKGNEGTSSGVTNWDDITGSTVSVSGNTGSHTINVEGAFYRWTRAVYTRTSGIGTLNVRINVKGV